MATVPQIDPATLTQWLTDARNALHQLSIGKQVVEIVVDGYVTKYGRANIADLRAYISQLEDQIAGTSRIGAIGFIF